MKKSHYLNNIGVRLSPKNLKRLPIGKHTISANPYVTSPDFVVTQSLHVYERDGERVYRIGDGLSGFSLIILEGEDGKEYLEGIASILGFGFSTKNMSNYFFSYIINPRGSFKDFIKRTSEELELVE